jgi:hypothetical protein
VTAPFPVVLPVGRPFVDVGEDHELVARGGDDGAGGTGVA